MDINSNIIVYKSCTIMSTYDKYMNEILRLNKQIKELSWRKIELESFICEKSYALDCEEYNNLFESWNGQSQVFLEKIQECIDIVNISNIKDKVIEEYHIEVTPHSYTKRGSDNYLVSWSNIESHSCWSYDEYLNLPKVNIELNRYNESNDEEWINPDYPTYEDSVKAAKTLENEYKKKISNFFDTQYNRNEHLKYLITRCINRFSQESSWDYRVLKPILKNHGFTEVAEILESMLPKDMRFFVKRLLINLLMQKLKR